MSESFPRERATDTSDPDGDLLDDLYAQEKSAMSISQGGVMATCSAARLGSTSSSSIASAVAERSSLRNFELPSQTSRSALNSASVSGQVISSSSPAKASISSTEWTCHLVPGVKSYPREIFLAVDQYKPAKPDAVPASTVRYTTEDALTFSNSDSIREAKCMIEAQLRQSFPEPKYEFKIFLKRPPLCTGSWTMDITTNDYELLPYMAKEVFVVNFEREVVFRVKDVGPAHPLNVTMISIFLPRGIQPIDAWEAAKEDMEEHIARYEGSHGCYYQVLAGFSSTSANYYTHLGFETHVMQIQIKVPSENTGRPLTETERAFEETEPPIAAFERVQGWITIRGTSCRTKMMHRFEFCKEHKNNWCGETMQDGSGRVVNDKIHTLKECVCTICGALGHSRFSCAKRPPQAVPIFFDEDFERSKESRDRLNALAAEAAAAAEAEDKEETERIEKQRSKKRAEPCSPLRPNLFEGVPCSEKRTKV